MRITVFTPTYNRAYCLRRLFDSLKNQTFRDFEWVIVDDGSVDNTTELVEKMIESLPGFPIVYKKTENGGKHRAINRGIDLACGELLFFLDSDDWLRKDALEWIDKVEESIPKEEKTKYAGVQGLKVYPDGRLVGRTYEKKGYFDCTTIERNKNNIYGDKAEVYYTDLLRKYPFPEIEGEKFLTERLVWNKIAYDGYLVRYFNEGIYYCEYLEDGLTYGGNCLYARNPKQWAMAIHQDYAFGGTSFYNTTIQIYIYFLYLKGQISNEEMYKNLNFSRVYFYFSLFLQWNMDLIRYCLHHKITIRRTATEDIQKNR